MVELPLLIWDGSLASTPSGTATPRAGLGTTPGGRVVLARGILPSARPLGEALLRAGCTRAVLLDRGAHATAFLDRAGTENPPRGKYEESVLYAVAAPLPPRGFRFEPSSLIAQKGR
jgi:hypothetical protein